MLGRHPDHHVLILRAEAVEGPAVIEPAQLTERIAIARRYLGTESGDAFIAANPEVDVLGERDTRLRTAFPNRLIGRALFTPRES